MPLVKSDRVLSKCGHPHLLAKTNNGRSSRHERWKIRQKPLLPLLGKASQPSPSLIVAQIWSCIRN